MSIQRQAIWFAFTSISVLLFSIVAVGAEDTTTAETPASKETLDQLQRIKESTRRRADPCEDFYGHACGNWAQNNIYDSTTSMYNILNSKYELLMTDMLDKLYNWPDDIKEHNQTFVDKTLTFYRSCVRGINTEYFEYVKPGNDLEWPFITAHDGKEKQNFDNFDAFALLGKLFSYGFNNVIIKSSLKRLENGTLQVSLAMPDNHYSVSQYVEETLQRIGFTDKSEKFSEYKEEIQNTHDLWQSYIYKHRYQTDEDFLTYDQVRAAYPKLAIFLENMLPKQLKTDDIVEIISLNYMKFLFEKEWQPSDAQSLCNYLMTEFFKYIKQNFYEDCDKSIRKYMHLAVDFLFYEEYMKPNKQQYNEAFNTLLQKVYTHLLALVEENNMKFTDNMLEEITEKLTKIHTNKGNLPDDVDSAMVEEFYSDVPDLTTDSYAQNILHLLQHHLVETFNCPKHVQCIGEVAPIAVNNVQNDLMIVPFASFNPPMYHWNFDPLFSVSLLGTVLGREIARSIDSSSLSSENVYETLHEDFNNHPELVDAKECMLAQENTSNISEYVADFAGARVAYRVYAKDYNVQPSFSPIPWQQLFFLNMAQYFCERAAKNADKYDAMDVRLRQIAMNMDEFAEAFKCPVGSKMNPEKKCRFY